jgi:hypothetical protein
MTFDPEIIMAYVDGELDLLTAKRIEKAMEADSDFAARIDGERSLRAKIAAHFNPVADEAVPDRLTALLTNVDTSLAERWKLKQRRLGFGIAQWSAIAASLVIGLFIGGVNLGNNPVGSRNGILVAQGALKAALDTQLASNQPANAKTRIGLTFRDKRGAICRTFDNPKLSGIACRNETDWQLLQTLSDTAGKGAYRQASSGRLAEAASEMMAGDALDADAERTEHLQGWK